MNEANQQRGRLLVTLSLALSVVLFGATLWLYVSNTAAETGSPPPGLPSFEGQSVTVAYRVDALAEQTAEPRALSDSGWIVVLDEDFEEGIDADTWLNVDRNGTVDGEFEWGVREVENTIAGGAQSAWGVGGGAQGELLDPSSDGFPKNVDSWLIHGPLDMSRLLNASLDFNYWFEAEAGDTFSVLVSTDGSNWEGKQTDSGGVGTWLGRSYSMSEYIGEPVVYLAFRFTSDDTGKDNKTGPFIDDIVLRFDIGSRSYLPNILVDPSPTPVPTVTPVPPTPTVVPTIVPPTPSPSGNINDTFTDDIDGWAMRRQRESAAFGFRHRGDTDGGRQGFLEMDLANTDSFFLVSPLLQAKHAPYNIEFVAKLKEPKDQHFYGVVFGSDWNGQACPSTGFTTCFNRYYELRVQYRDSGGSRYQQVKLRRIDTHDATGKPDGPVLFEWRKAGDVGTDDWVEIDVNVANDGTIRVLWNDKQVGEAKDSTLINQLYFGLLIGTESQGNVRVKYDYLKID